MPSDGEKFERIDGMLQQFFSRLGDDKETVGATLSALLPMIETFAQLRGPEMQKYWSEQLYQLADRLAPGDPLNDRMATYLRSRVLRDRR